MMSWLPNPATLRRPAYQSLADQFAQAIGAHRSKVSRALADDRGLINGTDQEKIMQAAKMRGVTIPAEDFLPSV